MATTLTALTVGAAPVSAKPSGDSDSSSTTTLVPKPPRQDSSSAQDGSGSGGGYGQDGGQRGRKQREQTAEAEAPSRQAPADVPAVQAKPPADPPAAPVTPVAPVVTAPENKAPENKAPESKAPEKTPQAPATTTPPVETPVVAAPPSQTEAPAPTTKVTKAQEAPADPTTPARPSTAAAEPAPSASSAPSATSVTPGPTTALAERPSPAGAVQSDTSTAPTDHAVAEGKPLAGLEGQLGEHAAVEAGPGRVEASATASATVTAGSSKSASPSTAAAREARDVRPIELLKPETLTAPVEDVATAKAAAAVDVKLPAPAPVQDMADLAKVVNVANFQFDSRADWNVQANRPDWDRRDNRPDWERRDNRPMGRDWDNRVRQWRPDWVQYDDYYRPVLFNPYRDPVRVVYVYRNAPRIVYIPPLQRIVMEVADLAAYSFTAVVVNAVNTAVNVAVGSFFGGGYYPGVGVPLPPPPPPVLSYANVPVQVRYSDAVYQPFRVQRIVDAGDDVQYGERRVLLDGVTPAWGQWTQSPSGERQFEVHRTQQFPGLDEPREAPLPGDYNLQLVNDQKGLENPNKALTIAAVTCGLLSLGAIGLSVYIGRRRRELV
ncbi:hypothetical protein [Mycobacterium sp. HM-7]